MAAVPVPDGNPRRQRASRPSFDSAESGGTLDQRYVDTVRALKVILRNLDHLEETITAGQWAELERLILKVQERLDLFLEADEHDEGTQVGEE
jgi:hypothetical protein